MQNKKDSIVWNLVIEQKSSTICIFIVSVVSTLLNSLGLTLLVPILFKVFHLSSSNTGPSKIEQIIDKYLYWLPGDGALSLLGFVIFLFIIKNTLIAFRVYLAANIGNKHLIYFRSELLKHYLKKDLHFFNKEGSGNILNNLILNVEKSSKVIIDSIEAIGMSIQLLAYGCVLTFISWQLFAICFLFFLPLVVLLKKMGRNVKRLSAERSNKFGALSQSLNDTIRGIRFVKLANRETDHIGWGNNQSQFLQEKLTKITFLSNIGQPITEVSAIIILMGFIAAIILLGTSSAVTIDSFFSFLLILSRALPLFNIVVNKALEIAGNYGTLTEVEKSLADNKWITTTTYQKSMGKIKNEIIFDKVTFSYPESSRCVLNEISFKIKQGESIAIVGPSGSGKSTITDLILRFYSPTGGRILIDNQDVNQVDIRDYRKRVGLVPQESIMFFSTIRENLCYFNPSAPEIDIWRVLDQADLADYVSSLPNGLDTNIGEGGVSLSGGQKQRLSIARTLLLNPEVLIFDEATSSLDSVSEAKIVDAIKTVSKGRTTITIAHRLATILHCDRVFLVEHGWLIESGKISELLQKSSRFKKYAESQNLKLVA